jgi:hypothetical protein
MKIANEMRMHFYIHFCFLSELIMTMIKTSTMPSEDHQLFYSRQESQLENYGKDYLKVEKR